MKQLRKRGGFMDRTYAYVDKPVHLSFPRGVQSDEHKVLYALWREGGQCIANIEVLTDIPADGVTKAVARLAGRRAVEVDDDRLEPLTMCVLSKELIKKFALP